MEKGQDVGEEEEYDVGGVEDYLFGPSKKPRLRDWKLVEQSNSVAEAMRSVKSDAESTPVVRAFFLRRKIYLL